MSKLHVLGYCEEMMPILAEIAIRCGYCGQIDVIENMMLPHGLYAIDVPGVTYNFVAKQDWKFTGEELLAFSVVKPASKQKVFREFMELAGFNRSSYLRLIDPTCFVSSTAILQTAIIIEPMSVVSAHTSIGFGVNIRRGVNIGHHAAIGDFVSINPGVNIGGKVRIDTGVTIGIGAVVLDSVNIGEGSVIGAGSVVTKSVPAGVVAYGNPCKVIRELGDDQQQLVRK